MESFSNVDSDEFYRRHPYLAMGVRMSCSLAQELRVQWGFTVGFWLALLTSQVSSKYVFFYYEFNSAWKVIEAAHHNYKDTRLYFFILPCFFYIWFCTAKAYKSLLDQGYTLIIYEGFEILGSSLIDHWLDVLTLDSRPDRQLNHYHNAKNTMAGYVTYILLHIYQNTATESFFVAVQIFSTIWGAIIAVNIWRRNRSNSLVRTLWIYSQGYIEFNDAGPMWVRQLLFQPLSTLEVIVSARTYAALANTFSDLEVWWKSTELSLVPEYEYSALESDRREIRLLYLGTGNIFSGMIKARLKCFTLTEAPHYEAVSYCWGKDARTKTILVDGKRFFVTPSAHAVLQACRYSHRERILWIDAICINQGDQDDMIREKTSQVKMMKDIYQSASRVIVWLGVAWNASLAGFEIARMYKELHDNDHLARLWYMDFLKTNPASSWRALSEVLTNVYFTRIWVLQEVTVGRKVEIYLGGIYIPWDWLIKLVVELQHPKNVVLRHLLSLEELRSSHKDRVAFENVMVMGLFRKYWRGRNCNSVQDPAIASILAFSYDFSSTNPRDQIFALLGLTRDATQESISINYAKSAEMVYIDTAIYIVRKHPYSALGLLAYAGIGYKRNFANLPSWIPDWSSTRPNSLFSHPLQNIKLVRASQLQHKRQRSASGIPIRVEAGSARLILKAAVLTTIIELKEPIQRIGGKTVPLQSAERIIEYLSRRRTEAIYKAGCELIGKKRTGKEFGAFPMYKALDMIDFDGWKLCTLDGLSVSGFVPRLSREGDVVVRIKGSQCLFALRPVVDSCEMEYQLVGECHIPLSENAFLDSLGGLMLGVILSEAYQDITIV